MATSAGTPRPAVVLVPGTACTASLWHAQQEALTAHPRGNGPRVTVAVPTAATIPTMIDEVMAGAQDPVVLVGHSLGGIVAMAAARLAPERVAGLALLSTTARPPRPEQRRAWDAWSAQAAAGRYDDLVGTTLFPLMVHPDRRDDAQLRAVVAQMAADTGMHAFRRQLAAQQTRVDERPALAGLRCPVLVVAAAQDALCPVELHEEIAELVPGAELAVVEGSGHLSPLERPQEVTELLTTWLPRAGVPARPTTMEDT